MKITGGLRNYLETNPDAIQLFKISKNRLNAYDPQVDYVGRQKSRIELDEEENQRKKEKEAEEGKEEKKPKAKEEKPKGKKK